MGAQKLVRFFVASGELMQLLARTSEYFKFSDFYLPDIITWNCEMVDSRSVKFAGVGSLTY